MWLMAIVLDSTILEILVLIQKNDGSGGAVAGQQAGSSLVVLVNAPSHRAPSEGKGKPGTPTLLTQLKCKGQIKLNPI